MKTGSKGGPKAAKGKAKSSKGPSGPKALKPSKKGVTKGNTASGKASAQPGEKRKRSKGRDDSAAAGKRKKKTEVEDPPEASATAGTAGTEGTVGQWSKDHECVGRRALRLFNGQPFFGKIVAYLAPAHVTSL